MAFLGRELRRCVVFALIGILTAQVANGGRLKTDLVSKVLDTHEVELRIYHLAMSAWHKPLKLLNLGLDSLSLGGAVHCSVAVHGKEYAYGYTDDILANGTSKSGIHYQSPDQTNYEYWKTIPVGTTTKSLKEVNKIVVGMMKPSMGWTGEDYDMLTHNCCHFAVALLCNDDALQMQCDHQTVLKWNDFTGGLNRAGIGIETGFASSRAASSAVAASSSAASSAVAASSSAAFSAGAHQIERMSVRTGPLKIEDLTEARKVELLEGA